MKTVILLECNRKSFESFINKANEIENTAFLDTGSCDEKHEYFNLSKNIRSFIKSNDELLLVRFSGRDSVIKDLGDSFSVMIFALSCNPEKSYYYENIQQRFSELLNIFKETR